MEDLHYWLALHNATGIGAATLSQLFDHFTQPKHLFNTPDSLSQLNLAPKQKKAIEKALQEPDWLAVEKTLLWLEDPENHVLLYTDPLYPPLLQQIHSPPPILFVKGQAEQLSKIQLAMVGSRNPTIDGSETAWQFAHHLAQEGMVITSGMALGIDAQSHKGALEAKGQSIAVAGTGLDRIYPARHKELAWQLIEKGAIISEYPLGTGPLRYNFPQRNRIISGLSIGTLVVEAALQSGSLITAKTALEQAREVFAIPGSIHNPLSRGCHKLIKMGAKLVETAEDIIEELSPLMLASQMVAGGTIDIPDKSIKPVSCKYSLLPKIQQKILQNIGSEPVSTESLINRSKLSASEISANLVLLEVDDYIQSHPGGLVSLKPR